MFLETIRPVIVVLQSCVIILIERIALPPPVNQLKGEKSDKNEQEPPKVKNTTSKGASSCNNLLAGSGGLTTLQTARGVLRERGGSGL